MVQTKKSNLVNVEVFADAVKDKLGNAIKLYPVSYVQSFANEQVGSIKVPKYAYIGDAVEKAEGVAIDPSLLNATSEDLTIKTIAKAVELTDEAVKGGFGDPVGEAEDQVVKAVSNKIDNDAFAAMAGASLTQNVAAMDATGFFSAQALFGEDQDGAKTLFVNPIDAVAIQTNEFFKDGIFYGATVSISNKVEAGTAYLVKDGAVGIYLAQEVDVETDRDILSKVEVVAASAMFATHVRNEAGVVKITIGA